MKNNQVTVDANYVHKLNNERQSKNKIYTFDHCFWSHLNNDSMNIELDVEYTDQVR